MVSAGSSLNLASRVDSGGTRTSVRPQQWHQLDLLAELDEPTAVPASTATPIGLHPVAATASGLVGVAVRNGCTTCGWPVDDERNSTCDVDNCPIVPK